MEKHEFKARVETQMDEWKRNLDIMMAKAEDATGDVKVAYTEQLAALGKQYDALKVKAAAAWDVADDKWDDTAKDLETGWDEWTDRAKRAWSELTK